MSVDDDVSATLNERLVHDTWTKGYRTPENDPFYQMAFDFIGEVYGEPGEDPVLDAGCGSSVKSIHLARRGYSVTAVDFSESILDVAKQAVAEQRLQDKVSHRRADLTGLPFADGTFSRVLCWGVLMHVPDVDKAIGELARVTRPGGVIIISENNVASLQAWSFRILRKLLRRARVERRMTPAGLETWEETPVGRVMTRQADIQWMIDRFARGQASLVERRAGEFSQIFTLLPWRPARLFVHAFNGFWFRRIRWPGPALGNLLIFRRR